MNINIAILDESRKIAAINVYVDDHVLSDGQVVASKSAYVNGYYINGYFIPPKPYPSWLLDEQTCLWQPPTPYPNDGNMYQWNEVTGEWTLTALSEIEE